MFRWLRERRQNRRKVHEGGIKAALQRINHPVTVSPSQPYAPPPSVAEALAAQLVLQQMANDAATSSSDCSRTHGSQSNHGSSHSSHDYAPSNHSSSHDSGSSYDSGSSSSGGGSGD